MNGTSKPVRPGDMVMRDAEGICCSIIYGQDNRSPITSDTTHVLYVAYAPPGVSVETINAQLFGIEDNIKCFSETIKIEQRTILTA